jgi:hypothetical protein
LTLFICSDLQSLGSSNFKLIYSTKDSCPKHQHEVFGSLHSFLTLYAQQNDIRIEAAEDIFKRLQEEVLQPSAGLCDALGDVARLAQRIWSSDQKLIGAAGCELEVCSLLNAAIRADNESLLRAAMPLIRAINSLCVIRGARPDRLLRFPPEHRCFRGGALPDSWLTFFQAGVKYRVPGFLASSFERTVCFAPAPSSWSWFCDSLCITTTLLKLSHVLYSLASNGLANYPDISSSHHHTNNN